MHVMTFQSARTFASSAADWVAGHLARKPRSVLALPTGRTPLGLYAELIDRSRRGGCTLAQTHIFNLDEYWGLGPADPCSYAEFLRRHLLAPLGLGGERVRLLQGDARDGAQECRAYDAAIAACGGIDLCILGLGVNGHIAFNEPGDDWNQSTHLVELSPATRAAHARQAAHAWTVPTHGVTMGIRTLLAAHHVLLLIAGGDKHAARAALGRGVSDPRWPVTSLLGHPDLTVIELS